MVIFIKYSLFAQTGALIVIVCSVLLEYIHVTEWSLADLTDVTLVSATNLVARFAINACGGQICNYL